MEITINDDNFFEELPEAFNVSLVGDPADPVTVSPDAATVFIFDGEFEIQLHEMRR